MSAPDDEGRAAFLAWAHLCQRTTERLGTDLADLAEVVEGCPSAIARLHLRNLRVIAEATFVAIDATVADVTAQLGGAESEPERGPAVGITLAVPEPLVLRADGSTPPGRLTRGSRDPRSLTS